MSAGMPAFVEEASERAGTHRRGLSPTGTPALPPHLDCYGTERYVALASWISVGVDISPYRLPRQRGISPVLLLVGGLSFHYCPADNGGSDDNAQQSSCRRRSQHTKVGSNLDMRCIVCNWSNCGVALFFAMGFSVMAVAIQSENVMPRFGGN